MKRTSGDFPGGPVVKTPLSSRVALATPWTAACQASLSFTVSWSLLKLMSIESVMPSNHLRGKAWGCARVTSGPKRPHLGVCPGPSSTLKGRQGSRGCTPESPVESGLTSRGSKGLRSSLEPLDSVKVIQSCPTLCDPMDYRVCGILLARILEWVAIPFSRGSS